MRRVLQLVPRFLVLGACQQDEAIRFSAVLPLTGQHEIYGQAVRKGVELGYEHLQADKSFAYQIDLKIVDSKGDPATAKELLGQEINAGALAVIGGVMSIEAIQMVEVADRYDRVLLSPSADRSGHIRAELFRDLDIANNSNHARLRHILHFLSFINKGFMQ